jgi:hypothetical protein
MINYYYKCYCYCLILIQLIYFKALFFILILFFKLIGGGVSIANEGKDNVKLQQMRSKPFWRVVVVGEVIRVET